MNYENVTRITAQGARGEAKNYEFFARPNSQSKFVLNKKVAKSTGNQTNKAVNKVLVDSLTEAANLLSTNEYLINLIADNGKRALRQYAKVVICHD